MLTVEMSNYADKCCSKPSIFDKTVQLNATKRTKLFSDKNNDLETSFLAIKTNPNGFTEVLPRSANVNSQMNHQLFKVPDFDSLPAKKSTIGCIRSPRRRVQTGRVKNDLKLGQQSKMSLIPRPSFINSRKPLCSSRSSQLNARKELIKKMVFLAECALKENKEIKEIKQSTPVKMLAGLTPKKTPRSGGYFVLPEFKKKVQKLDEIRTPIQDFIKKEVFDYSAKPTPLVQKITEISLIKSDEENISNLSKTPNEMKSMPDRNTKFTAILHNCEIFNAEISLIHEKLKVLDDSFENKLKNLPDYRVYNEFCFYQSKKEDLYREIQMLELDLRNFIASHTKVGNKLKAYVKKKQEFFREQINIHKDFEQAVSAALEKCKKNEEKKIEEEKPEFKLRRSLRLSKIKKSRFEERTPMTKKLKKLDIKSKGIQKSGKVHSP